MNDTCRDMDDYVRNYRSLPFEPIQSLYRRKLVLRQIARFEPNRVLEIGCGHLPIFTDLPDEVEVTVVEPTKKFGENARRLGKNRKNIKIVEGFVESVELGAVNFDMVILSCLLHEVPDPPKVLARVHDFCQPQTVVHVNVPNAFSLHRLLAVAMGICSTPHEQSGTQRRMQQRNQTYDRLSLASELSAAGFVIIDEGSMFVKPFTHMQMQALVDSSFMTPAMLDGFDELAASLPNFGSEIWANVRVK